MIESCGCAVITQELEKHFDDPPLLPSSSELREEVEEVCKQASGMQLLTVVVLTPLTGGVIGHHSTNVQEWSLYIISLMLAGSQYSCVILQQLPNAMTAATQSAQRAWQA